MWHLTCNLSFYELLLVQLKKNQSMQTLYGTQYCLPENVQCFLPCYFYPLCLSVQNHNKDPAMLTILPAICTCVIAQVYCACPSVKPSSLPPIRNISSHLLLHWWEPFFVGFYPEVCSTAYTPSSSGPAAIQIRVWHVVSSLYVCVSFPWKQKTWKEKGDVVVVESTLGYWDVNFTCFLWSCAW